MIDQVFEGAAAGDRRLLARAISLIEDRADGVLGAIGRLTPSRQRGPGSPAVVGITGPPGAGKSTFVDQLITQARGQDQRVAVVAVDPSSPFSGGAILGDRIRMDQHVLDPGVFVRSLSSRGHLGGLCRAAGQVVDLLDAAGFDLVLVETVGVGQSELAVCEVADTAVEVLTPESGDTVQTMKAGLLEIADVFVINKADREGARPDWVVDQTFDLFDRLGASDEQLDFTTVFASAIQGWASDSSDTVTDNMDVLFRTIVDRVDPPDVDREGPLQLQVSALDYSSYVGVMGIGRIARGRARRNAPVTVIGGTKSGSILPPSSIVTSPFTPARWHSRTASGSAIVPKAASFRSAAIMPASKVGLSP